MRDKKTLIRLFVEAYLSGDTTDFWAIAQHLGIYYEVLELLEKEDICRAPAGALQISVRLSEWLSL